jgi:RHS repeat-associated protein
MNGHRLSRRVSVLVAALLAFGLSTFAPAHADETLTYDPNGNIVSRTVPGGTTTYDYDDLDRLKSEAGPARTQTLTWDANGNRTGDASGSHTFTPNTDRPLTIAGQSVTVDPAGNITQARNLGFVWNPAGQLQEVRQGSPSGTLLASYTYDYQGRRTRKVLSGSGPLNYRTTIYTYDQYDRLSGEYNGAGIPRRAYVWRDAVPLAVISHSGTNEVVYYLETDHLGTPIAARDANGTVLWRWEADAFGATPPNEDPDGDQQKVTINLRFPGQYFDAESGLHYNWHRYYDPTIGRYMSSDPIGLTGGLNLFGYANQNPLKYVDPLGLSSDDPLGGSASPPVGFPDPSAQAQQQLAQQLTQMLKQLAEKICPDDQSCTPPEGTMCYEDADYGKPHAGLSPHYHVYQMQKKGGTCFWKYLGGKIGVGVFAVPPQGTLPCSSYPNFVGRGSR